MPVPSVAAVGRDLGPVTALAGPFFDTDAVVASAVSCQDLAPGSVRPGPFDFRPSQFLSVVCGGALQNRNARLCEATLMERDVIADDEERSQQLTHADRLARRPCVALAMTANPATIAFLPFCQPASNDPSGIT